MTDQEKNQLIADFCPGKFKLDKAGDWFYIHPEDGFHRCINGSIVTDLNAINVAENGMTDDEFEDYRWTLWDLCKDVGVCKWNRNYLFSAARQRAEALIMLIN